MAASGGESLNELIGNHSVDLDKLRILIGQLVHRKIPERIRRKIDESDIIQQSLIDIHVASNQFKGEHQEQVTAWVRQIVENNIADVSRYFLKARCRSVDCESEMEPSHVQQVIDEQSLTGSTIIARDEEIEKLAVAVEILSADLQYLLELRHRMGLTFVQIGEKLGISEMAARKRWNRALDLLREQLKRGQPESDG